jgi:hypothetical protein
MIVSLGRGGAVKNDDLRNGISMHRIRVGGGVAGFIVVAGFLCIGLVGISMLRYFLGICHRCWRGLSIRALSSPSMETESAILSIGSVLIHG